METRATGDKGDTVSGTIDEAYGNQCVSDMPDAALVLDVDHTLLQGITVDHYNEYAKSTYCQKFSYKPSKTRYKKYIDRMADEVSGRMIHYTLPTPNDGETMDFYVAIRPCLFELLLHPLILSGRVSLLLASANEDERTEAILEKLPFFQGGATLRERIPVCRYIPRAEFLEGYKTTRSGKKRIKDIRRWAEKEKMLSKGNLVFLDDRVPSNIQGSPSPQDFVFWISPFHFQHAINIFSHQRSTWNLDTDTNSRWDYFCCKCGHSEYCKCSPEPSSEDINLMVQVSQILFEGQILPDDFSGGTVGAH